MRTATVTRKTKETDIFCELNIDGKGTSEISTGIGFFDHMLEAFSRHGFFDLKLTCNGDLNVDCHHTIEDCGIVLGEAFLKAIGDKKGIKRYGSFLLPMDDSLVLSAVDICGRPYLVFDMEFTSYKVGEFETEMVKEFFYAFSYSSKINIHIKEMAGLNNHHKIEAAFKSFAKSMDMATSIDERIEGTLSTKGVLA